MPFWLSFLVNGQILTSESSFQCPYVNPLKMAEKFFDLLENGFNTINHILIGFITIYLTFICSQTNMSARSWHVLLCTFGVSLMDT